MRTRIFDVTPLTKDEIYKADALREPEAMDKVNEARKSVKEAAKILANGGLVAFPTETVYGLGANAFDEKAVDKLYKAKGRPSDNPMIVHIARASEISLLVEKLSPEVIRLADSFWPGPLTMVLRKRPKVPGNVTGELDTVAVRLPDHPVATELIRAAACPVAAPSANLSGSPSPTQAEHVIADLDGKVDVILAGTDCSVGIESTVVDLTASPPEILRPGVLSAGMLTAVLDTEVFYHSSLLNHIQDGGAMSNQFSFLPRDMFTENRTEGSDTAPKSPGMKYKHYAPNAEMLVIEGEHEKVIKEISRLKALNEGYGNKVGVLVFEEQSYIEAAHDFYARLRDLDKEGVDMIIAGAVSDKNEVGFAVMNRMMKSAGYHIAKVT